MYYFILLPVELTFPEIVAEMSRTLGREIHYEPVERETFAQLMRAGGRREYVAQHIMEIAQNFQNGIFAGTNDIVRNVGQRNPMTVHEFVAQNAPAFETNK